MQEKRNILSTMRRASRRARQRGINKYVLIILYFFGLSFAFLALAAIFTQNIMLAFIMKGALYATALVSILGMIWHIVDVVKQVKKEHSSDTAV